MEELPALLDTKVGDYFADCEPSELEAAAIERHKDQTLHDFVIEEMKSESLDGSFSPVERLLFYCWQKRIRVYFCILPLQPRSLPEQHQNPNHKHEYEANYDGEAGR